MTAYYIIFNNSAHTSQRTYYHPITKADRLMLLNKIMLSFLSAIQYTQTYFG